MSKNLRDDTSNLPAQKNKEETLGFYPHADFRERFQTNKMFWESEVAPIVSSVVDLKLIQSTTTQSPTGRKTEWTFRRLEQSEEGRVARMLAIIRTTYGFFYVFRF